MAPREGMGGLRPFSHTLPCAPMYQEGDAHSCTGTEVPVLRTQTSRCESLHVAVHLFPLPYLLINW